MYSVAQSQIFFYLASLGFPLRSLFHKRLLEALSPTHLICKAKMLLILVFSPISKPRWLHSKIDNGIKDFK